MEPDEFKAFDGTRESRRHPRLQSKRLVRFMQEDGGEIKSIFKIINVSQGGLQLACRDPIKANSILRLNIESPDLAEPLSLKARVMWINDAPDANGLFYSGVSFLEMRDDARAIVLKAIA